MGTLAVTLPPREWMGILDLLELLCSHLYRLLSPTYRLEERLRAESIPMPPRKMVRRHMRRVLRQEGAYAWRIYVTETADLLNRYRWWAGSILIILVLGGFATAIYGNVSGSGSAEVAGVTLLATSICIWPAIWITKTGGLHWNFVEIHSAKALYSHDAPERVVERAQAALDAGATVKLAKVRNDPICYACDEGFLGEARVPIGAYKTGTPLDDM